MRIKIWWLPLYASLLFASLSYAEDGVTDNSILIGQTIGLTGIIAGPVKEMNEGANAYFSNVNSSGGIHGRKIVMQTLDDRFDPGQAAINAERLIKQEHVFALFQSRGTPHTQAILPVLQDNNVPLIAPSTGSSVFHHPVNRLLFNVHPKFQNEVHKAVEHFATVGLASIGLLHVDDPFGQDGLQGFSAAMSERKLVPALVETFARVNPDYAATAAKIVKANPQALIIVSSSANTIGVIKEIRAKGGRMQIMTLSNNSSQSFIAELGPYANGIIISQITPAPHLISTPLGQEFKAAAKATGATVSYAAMEGFVNAKVLVEGLRRAGKNLTRDALIRALESMHRVDLGGILISYSPNNHSGSNFVELTMIGKDGKFIR